MVSDDETDAGEVDQRTESIKALLAQVKAEQPPAEAAPGEAASGEGETAF